MFLLCDPGSELNVHEKWFPQSAMDLLLDAGRAVAEKVQLYRALDRMVPHKAALEHQLRQKWGELFQAEFEVLLYDLTSTYFEGLVEEWPLAQRGYSRDHRPDCKQLSVALIVNSEVVPITHEIFAGNTRDVTTLEAMMDKVESKYGKARRTWVFDRGIISEANLQKLRERNGCYLAGTLRSKMKDFESELPGKDWHRVRDQVEVKLQPGDDGDLYVITRSTKRRAKENAMRRKPMGEIYDHLVQLNRSVEKSRINNDDALVKQLGRLQERHTNVFAYVECHHARNEEAIAGFSFRLCRQPSRRHTGRMESTYCAPT